MQKSTDCGLNRCFAVKQAYLTAAFGSGQDSGQSQPLSTSKKKLTVLWENALLRQQMIVMKRSVKQVLTAICSSRFAFVQASRTIIPNSCAVRWNNCPTSGNSSVLF